MQAVIDGEFLNAEKTKSGKGFMVSVLQENESCELYAPMDGGFSWPTRMTPVRIVARIRDGYEGKGYQATVKSIDVRK